MDELIDILTSKGAVTGKTALKSQAHKKGWFHPTVHIWLFTPDGKILVQQRAKKKDTHPLLWDVSVAGHVGAGEEIRSSALREINEEIGLEITEGALEKIGVFKSVQKHSNDLIDCEFHHAFLCELNVPLNNLIKQESEVENLALVPLVEFGEAIYGGTNTRTYVPHELSYYKTIINAIKKKLEGF